MGFELSPYRGLYNKKKIRSSHLFLTDYSDWFGSDLNSHFIGLPAWLEVYTDTI